jgi:hypothetical protein
MTNPTTSAQDRLGAVPCRIVVTPDGPDEVVLYCETCSAPLTRGNFLTVDYIDAAAGNHLRLVRDVV